MHYILIGKHSIEVKVAVKLKSSQVLY